MNGTLITYGVGIPRYEREVFCSVDPQVFVELEAKALARQTGEIATAVLLKENREEVRSTICGFPLADNPRISLQLA